MRASQLKHFALLAEFSEEEREALADLLEERSLPDGKSAFREGAEAEGMVLLSEGRLKLKSKRTGAVVGVLEAPAHLGAASLFAFGKREVTALADGGATIHLLSRTGLPRLADDSPRAAFRLAEAVAAELAGLVRVGLDALAEHDLGDTK
ncbi:MAG: cyclic nucleotide-binding domain-containing protein [bacterium]|nr:cyclic nucleotide-binding domain-containing protein [bacterium]